MSLPLVLGTEFLNAYNFLNDKSTRSNFCSNEVTVGGLPHGP